MFSEERILVPVVLLVRNKSFFEYFYFVTPVDLSKFEVEYTNLSTFSKPESEADIVKIIEILKSGRESDFIYLDCSWHRFTVYGLQKVYQQFLYNRSRGRVREEV